MENSVVFPHDCEVVGSIIIANGGPFLNAIYYVRGFHPELKRLGTIRAINGTTGPETEVRIAKLLPTHCFDVVEAQAPTP